MKHITLLCLLCLSCIAHSTEWTFTTPYHAQEFRYSYDAERGKYRFSSADVTVNVPSCESEEFSVCVLSNYLDLVIPRKRLVVGDKWAIKGTEFEYIRLLPELSFWGTTQKNVMIISVMRDYNFYHGVNEKKYSTQVYSREAGLL